MAAVGVTSPPPPDASASVEAVRHGGPDRRSRRDPHRRGAAVPEVPDPDTEETDAPAPPAGRLDVVA